MVRAVFLVLLSAILALPSDAEASRRRRRGRCRPSCCVQPQYVQPAMACQSQAFFLEHPRTCAYYNLGLLEGSTTEYLYLALRWPTDCITAEQSFVAGSFNEPVPCPDMSCVYLRTRPMRTVCPSPDNFQVLEDPNDNRSARFIDRQLISFTLPNESQPRYAYVYRYMVHYETNRNVPRDLELRFGFETETSNGAQPAGPARSFDEEEPTLFHVTFNHVPYVVLTRGPESRCTTR